MNKSNQFWIRVILVFFVIIVIVLLGRFIMLPDSWDEYGYYRGDYIQEEASKTMNYGTNESCSSCHEEVYELISSSKHKKLSCEICHDTLKGHAKDSKKIAKMKMRKGKNQISLCLKCHQTIIGRSKNFPTIVSAKEHLEKQNVKTTHTCDQCHTVHAPLENINHITQMKTLREAINDKKIK